MGKKRKEKFGKRKNNPTGIPSEKELEQELEDLTEDNQAKALQNIVEDLQSPNVEEKISALQNLESIYSDASKVTPNVEDGLSKIIAPLLLDHNKAVQAASARTLHIIASSGEEACEKLLEDDVMTPLAAVLHKFHDEWHPNINVKPTKDLIEEKETFIQSVMLLWTLCENTEKAINCSNRENLMSVLTRFLNLSNYGIDVSVIAAQCMLTLSEDNAKAVKELKNHEQTLLSLLELKNDEKHKIHEIVPLKTLACGLIINCSLETVLESESILKTCKVVKILSETLNVNSSDFLKDLSLSEKENKIKKKCTEIKKILGAQQQALEILANICTDDKNSDDENADLDDSDSTERDYEFMEDDSGNDKILNSILPVELIEVITNNEVIPKVWKLTHKIEEAYDKFLASKIEGKSVLKQIHVIRCRAFLCLNNFLANLDIESLGGAENLYQMFLEIGKIIFQETPENDIELLESATSAMRATVDKLAEAKVSKAFEKLTLEDIQPLLSGEKQCSNCNVRANLIRVLGNLALILTTEEGQNSQELVKYISTFLLDTAATESELWVAAESLDAIIDIYSEDDTDRLAMEINLVGKLQSLVPILKNKVRQRKRQSSNGNISIVSTVNANLVRFIKYKSRRVSKFLNNT